MVKADAYGHGAKQITQRALSHHGITEFGLATFGEAQKLSTEIADKNIQYIIFSEPSLRENHKIYSDDNRFIPVISSLELLNTFFELKMEKSTPLFLKFG